MEKVVVNEPTILLVTNLLVGVVPKAIRTASLVP